MAFARASSLAGVGNGTSTHATANPPCAGVRGRCAARRAPRTVCHDSDQGPSTSGGQPKLPTPAPALSTDAILDRIARAKKYKSGGDGASTTQQTAEVPASPLPNLGPAKVDWGAMVGFLEDPTNAAASAPPAYPPGQAAQPALDPAAEEAERAERERRFLAPAESKNYMDILMQAPRRAGAGSADRAADALAAVLAEADSGITPEMRMEEFTAAKEQRLRAMGAEIITADPTYRPGDGVDVRVSMPGAGMMAGPEAIAAAERAAAEAAAAQAEIAAAAERAAEAAAAARSEPGSTSGTDEEVEAYKPKVSTWGVFPRPKDISAAMGGGRNLKPGQELETPQQRAAREASYAAALAAYKVRAGLDIDPDDEEKAMKLYEEGMVLFNAGSLRPAYEKFEAALVKAPTKTKVGGMATLQKAIILDTFGQGEAAQKLYKSIANHAVGPVARKAKQMLFGFEAMDFMKAQSFSYGPKKSDFDKYFRGFADRNKVYVATEEDRATDELQARLATAIAVAVIVGPIVAVAGLAAGR